MAEDVVSAVAGFDVNGANFEGDLGLDAVYDVPLEISVVLGHAKMTIQEIIALKDGDVIELDRLVGDDVDVFINERLVAKGEVVLVHENIGITMTEIVR